MGGKSGSGGGPIQFAPYLEAVHSHMLAYNEADQRIPLAMNVITAMNNAFSQSPYNSSITVDPNLGFLGSGGAITSYTPLFSLFKTFMQDVNLNTLWAQLYTSMTSGAEITEAVKASSDLLQDEIDTKVLPKFLAGYRDINAVMSTAFVIGKTIIADSKAKAVADVTSKLKLRQLDLVNERWAKTLAWNTLIVSTCSDILKLFYTASFDTQSRSMEYAVKHKLWDLSLFEYGRAVLGALTGSAAAKPDLAPSQAAKAIAGVAGGAAAGAMLGGEFSNGAGGTYAGYGAAAGGVLGLAASFA